MFSFTEFKVCNISNQLRRGQNRRYFFTCYLTDGEIENWIIWKFGEKKDWKLIKRSCS